MADTAKDDRKYSRVYHQAVDDDKFRDVWDNDARLALWLRLLVMADAQWPASATIPRSAKGSPLKALVDCGLVDMQGQDHYRIHGMDAERTARSEHAQQASNARWNATGNARSNADSNARIMPSKVEKNIEEVNRADNGEPARAPFRQRRIRNTVDANPLLREMREAQMAHYAAEKKP